MDIIRVLLADDHRILREGIRALIEDQEDMEVVGETGRSTQTRCSGHGYRHAAVKRVGGYAANSQGFPPGEGAHPDHA